MNARLTVAVALLLTSSALAGCIGLGEDAEGTVENSSLDAGELPEAPSTEDGRDLTIELTAEDEIPGPSWEVGQWFGYHVFFGMDDEEGIHYNAVVTEDLGSSWMVATDNQQAAKFEAMFDLFLLGEFAKSDLSTTSAGDPWNWYSWPLTDGKTWTATVDTADLVGGEPDPVEITFEATYNPGISTQDGTFPGFDVVGRTAEGNLTVEYDYVPALGWFGHLFIYDPDSDGQEWILHIMTMGSGTGWEGTYYIDEATPMFEQWGAIGVDPGNPAAPLVQPYPYASATVDEEADYVTGFVFNFAFAGAQDTSLIDPEHNRHGFTTLGAPFAFNFLWIDVAAIPGQWHLENLGAGVAAGGGAFVYAIAENTGTL